MSTSVLVTGGAGFIGSALTHRLVKSGYDVAVMDVLHPQVHAGRRAVDLPPSVRLLTGDVTHAPDWDAVLRLFHPSQIVHLAAETGTAQSLSQATRQRFRSNVVGTAQLLDALSRSALGPDQFVLASSRAVYGEGTWQCGTQTLYPRPRISRTAPRWYLGSRGAHGQTCGAASELRGPDGAPAYQHLRRGPELAQEHMLAAWTGGHGANLTVLRLQNVYGPGESLTNSYTGIVALFARLARQQHPLEVYEDGRIVRDFVFIEDVVDAMVAAHCEGLRLGRAALDMGEGIATTIHELARKITAICDAPEPIVVPKFRDGDVRAASCNIESAKKTLHWHPKWALEDGLRALLGWSRRAARIACRAKRWHICTRP